MREEEKVLVASHRLVASITRLNGFKIECKMECKVCGNVVLVYVWEDDYFSSAEAEERAVKSGKKSFRYDCVSHLAASVMES